MGSGRILSGLLIGEMRGLEGLDCWRLGCLFGNEY